MKKTTSKGKKGKDKGKSSSNTNKFASLESRIIDVAEVATFIKACIYGRGGTGKTTFFGSFPKPMLVLDVRDKGTKSIRTRPDTKVIQIKSWDDIEDIYWYLVENPQGFKSVVWDTVTQSQDLCLSKVKGSSGGSMTSRRAWGEVAEIMKTWILNYRDLDMNVGFAAQDRLDSGTDGDDEVDDENTIMPSVGPAVIPSVAKTLIAAVDIVGQTFIRETEKKVKNKKDPKKTKSTWVSEYCMRVGPHALFTTKLRKDPETEGDVPKVVVNPTYDKLLQISLGEGEDDNGEE